MTSGKLITIEGIEGAGKSTALQSIKHYLVKHQIDVLVTREPGGTHLAENIRQLLLYPSNIETIQVETELLLIFAGRAQHISQCIKPALQSGKWVISDRYIDASYAYQGGGRCIDIRLIQTLDQWIVDDCYPHLTFLMDLPVTVGFKRTEKRGGHKDRIEQEDIAFFERVRHIYLERATQDPNRIKVIDASKSILSVEKQLYHELDIYLEKLAQ
jgi:dTMP kinase